MIEEEYHRWREAAAQANQRSGSPVGFVENDHVSGVYEVIEMVEE